MGAMNDVYQGDSRLARIPSSPGIYAWYFRPRISNKDRQQRDITRISTLLENAFKSTSSVEVTATLRYGLFLNARSIGELRIGSKNDDLHSIIKQIVSTDIDFILDFFQDDRTLMLLRPVYIGITNDLNRRLYKEHFLSLVNYWSDESSINKFLISQRDASLESVMSHFGMPHSFALEARVRRFEPHDLVAVAHVTQQIPDDMDEINDIDSSASRRALERILHLLADPICGRK